MRRASTLRPRSARAAAADMAGRAPGVGASPRSARRRPWRGPRRYYLPAMLAAPMARDLGVSTPTVFAAFSVALVVSALLGP